MKTARVDGRTWTKSAPSISRPGLLTPYAWKRPLYPRRDAGDRRLHIRQRRLWPSVMKTLHGEAEPPDSISSTSSRPILSVKSDAWDLPAAGKSDTASSLSAHYQQPCLPKNNSLTSSASSPTSRNLTVPLRWPLSAADLWP